MLYILFLKYIPVYAKLLVVEKSITLWLSNEYDEFITTTERRKRTSSKKYFAMCKKNGIIKKQWDIDIKKQCSQVRIQEKFGLFSNNMGVEGTSQ